MQGPLAAAVEPYRPYGCKSPDWKRFLKSGEELCRGQMLLSADHKSKALVQEDGNFVVREWQRSRGGGGGEREGRGRR
jgi:hypothetical protein